MIETKITRLELNVTLSEKQLDNLINKLQYLQRKMKQSFYSVSGIDLAMFYPDRGVIEFDIDRPDEIEAIKKRITAIIIKHLN